MAYQKLQVGRVWGPVIINDDIDIPDIGTAVITAAGAKPVTSQSGKTIQVGTGANELGIKSGMIVVSINSTTGLPDTNSIKAKVIAIDGLNIITDNPNFTTSMVVAIFGPPSRQNGCVLYVGGGESVDKVDVKVLTIAGDIAVFEGIAVGSFLPVQVTRVLDGTSEGARILALW
jgi:hypothetical protein